MEDEGPDWPLDTIRGHRLMLRVDPPQVQPQTLLFACDCERFLRRYDAHAYITSTLMDDVLRSFERHALA